MMRRLFAAAVLSLLLAACAGTPPPPDWQLNALGALERAQAAYLSGDSRVEAAEFARARSEVARTARADLLARLELARCATRVASLVLEPCSGWAALAADAAAPERAYAAYLAGQVEPAQAGLLPPQHQAFAGGTVARPGEALAAVDDPLARLVAAAVLLQTGRADPVVLQVAVDAASAQGWRRPLLAWLGVQAQRADAAGEQAEAQRIRRRMALVTGLR